jgi:hypothetical protein
MRKLVWVSGLAAVVLSGGVLRADDAAGAKATIEKAIQAQGGADVLKKFTALTIKAKGTFYGMGDGIEYTSESSIQDPDKFRVEVKAGDFKFVQIINGDKGWAVTGDNSQEMDKDQLEEAKESLYAHHVERLVPLLGEGYKLSSLGDVKVGDRAAVGVRVERKGHRDISLFFDKESHLLIKVERRAKDVMAGGQEYTAETLYSDYKKVDGLQVPHKETIKRDGKRYIEQEVTEAKPAEKLDDNTFAKPA